MLDAFTRPLHVGDRVVYVHRWGSNIKIEERGVTMIDYATDTIRLDHSLGKVKPKNVVKLST